MDQHLSTGQCQARYPVHFLSERQLCARLGVSRTTLWRWMKDGHLPHSVQIGPRCVRWRLEDIEQWEAEVV